MPHSYTNLLTHVIFSTKDRRPHLDPALRPRVFGYIGGIVRELGGTALSINGPDDHVHMLVVLPATVAMANAMRVVKTNGSTSNGRSGDRSRGSPGMARSVSAGPMLRRSSGTSPTRRSTTVR